MSAIQELVVRGKIAVVVIAANEHGSMVEGPSRTWSPGPYDDLVATLKQMLGTRTLRGGGGPPYPLTRCPPEMNGPVASAS